MTDTCWHGKPIGTPCVQCERDRRANEEVTAKMAPAVERLRQLAQDEKDKIIDALRAENERLQTALVTANESTAYWRDMKSQALAPALAAENARLKANDLSRVRMYRERAEEVEHLKTQLAETHDDICENGHANHEDCTEACACVGSGKSKMERLQEENERLTRERDEARALAARYDEDAYQDMMAAVTAAPTLKAENERLTEELSATVSMGNDARATLTAVRRENARLKTDLAELGRTHCRDCCCARSWKALGVADYTGKSIPEHIEALKRKADAWDRLKKWAKTDTMLLALSRGSLLAKMAELEAHDG